VLGEVETAVKLAENVAYEVKEFQKIKHKSLFYKIIFMVGPQQYRFVMMKMHAKALDLYRWIHQNSLR
jgi:hypothetical protein